MDPENIPHTYNKGTGSFQDFPLESTSDYRHTPIHKEIHMIQEEACELMRRHEPPQCCALYNLLYTFIVRTCVFPLHVYVHSRLFSR